MRAFVGVDSKDHVDFRVGVELGEELFKSRRPRGERSRRGDWRRQTSRALSGEFWKVLLAAGGVAGGEAVCS